MTTCDLRITYAADFAHADNPFPLDRTIHNACALGRCLGAGVDWHARDIQYRYASREDATDAAGLIMQLCPSDTVRVQLIHDVPEADE